MIHRIWKYTGVTAYWLLLPLIFIYAKSSKPRARVLLTHDSHVLLVKNWLGADGWALPGGGLESNESPKDAAIREVQEELGFTIEPGALRHLGEYQSTERGGLPTKYYLFVVDLVSKPPLNVKSTEIVDYTWMSVADIHQAQNGVTNTVKQSVLTWSEAV